MNRKTQKIVLAVVGLLVLFFPVLVPIPYYVHALFTVFLMATMGLGWNLIGGYGAQLSLGHSVFFSIGAYSAVLLVIYRHVTPFLGVFLGMVLACVAAVLIGLPCFRLRGPFFTLATIAAGEITRTLLLHFQEFTGGANGVPLPFRGNDALFLQFDSKAPYYYIALAMMVAVFLIVRRLETAKIGRYLAAIREDQEAAESLGIQSDRVKMIALLISAAITAVCGVLYAFTLAYIDPDGVASLNLSIEIATVVIVGGIGTLWGPVLGAAVVVLLTELTNMYLGSVSGASLVLYGLLLMVVVLVRPRGLISLAERPQPKPSPQEAGARAHSA